MKLRVGGNPQASMETRDLRAQHADAIREMREHRGRCVTCEQAARRKRGSQPCGYGLELQAWERDLKAKVKESVALDQAPIPGQEALFGPEEVQ